MQHTNTNSDNNIWIGIQITPYWVLTDIMPMSTIWIQRNINSDTYFIARNTIPIIITFPAWVLLSIMYCLQIWPGFLS